ncbi:pimeloyl-ACP methyl ester carboxylesterase [Microbacterium resistens]|uniref:Pimeloyl-ACP methyl ester carboxylesterase n=1 Tax=Microbacterium resistens TaxID=156977 RepID=A0ABU1SAF1_9MICO|nr:alpha/beta fold hydrolase [Microbacterium resistens]MDR6866238.1 pimeloyl-ACP methyl ester carboxylesterase [Microbacterium resistens]
MSVLSGTGLSVRRREGAGRPVLFVHGFASRGRLDWPDAEWAAPLAEAGRGSILVDLPGHGGSPALGPLPTSAVVRLLAEAAGGEEVDVVGYSLGARLAWALASDRTVTVRRVVLGGLSLREPFTVVDRGAARRALTGGPAPSDPLTGMILHMITLPGNRSADLLDLADGLASEPFDPAVAAPTQPTLLLGGVEDPLVAGIDVLAAAIPDSRVIRVPGDHLSALHTPEFRRAALDFVAEA